MSEHVARVEWARRTSDFGYDQYDRNHSWHFDNGSVLEASASPRFLGDATMVDPEEAFVAALASCHMLTFLAIASRAHLPVRSYSDQASGVLAKDGHGQLSIQEVTLRPKVRFDVDVSEARALELHRLAHENCFLARSVKTTITVLPSHSSTDDASNV